MKLHPPIIQCVLQCLESIFEEHFYADKVLAHQFKKNRKLGSRDRKFIAEAVYDMVRWWRFLWHVLPVPESTQNYRYLLSLWLYWKKQILEESLVQIISVEDLQKRLRKCPNIAIENSIPDWLQKFGEAELGEKWNKNIKAMNLEAQVYLRVNTLLIDADSLQQILATEGIATRVLSEETLQLSHRKNVFVTKAFKQGFFEVQDFSSQQIVPLLGLAPGMRVIDACAGAGGKTLHMASVMKNKGKIIALDIHDYKLAQLKKRSRRAQVSIIESKDVSSTKVVKRLRESADALLLDVPCSGIGVLKRNPDTKWKLSEERLSELCTIQQEILQRYSKMLRPGGRMLYSTCSIFPSENQNQIKKFLETNSNWSLLKETHFFPADHETDGFYAALLQKN